MATKKRKAGVSKRRNKRKSPVRRAAGTSLEVARAASRLAEKIEQLRKELKEIKRALGGRTRRR